MRYIPPGVTDVQLYGVCQSTIHDPDPGYYRCSLQTYSKALLLQQGSHHVT